MMRPFWRYFGAKWKIARRYPSPAHPRIVEPFAGAAGYSLRYPDLDVLLVEKNPVVAEVWRFLIGASRSDIMAIPHVKRVDDLPSSLPEGARLFVGFTLGAGDTRPRERMSTMVERDGGWNRRRCAAQVERIKHWRVMEGSYEIIQNVRSTWFVDPPYQERGARDRRPGARGRVRYPCGADDIDFVELAQWCRSRRGQVIVCENEGATWLPFQPLVTTSSASPGSWTREAVWTNDRNKK